MTPLPILNGVPLSALQVSTVPARFVYGDQAVLTWLRLELLKRESAGMPRPQDAPVNWR
jgi:hypothetical protein